MSEQPDTNKEIIEKLNDSDKFIARSIEDIIDMLIEGGYLDERKVPEALINHINYRKELRTQLESIVSGNPVT